MRTVKKGVSTIALQPRLLIIAKRLRFWGISILLSLAILTFVFMSGIIINTSSSMPLGLYYKTATTHYSPGDIVGVRLERPLAIEAISRGYVSSTRLGHSFTPLLKQLIAVPGDNVICSSAAIVVNGKRYPAPIQFADHHGLPIVQFHEELNGVTQRYWVYGKGDPIHSWDSRYFGGLDQLSLIGVYKPLLTFRAS